MPMLEMPRFDIYPKGYYIYIRTRNGIRCYTMDEIEVSMIMYQLSHG